MGYFIGDASFPSTWLSMRTLAVTVIPPPPFPTPPPVIFGDHNQEYPVSPGWLKTIEGNGLIRIGTPGASTPFFDFAKGTPPGTDVFYGNNFPEPYPDDLVGRTVTTAGSTFVITSAAFTGGQAAGTGGDAPISVEWFQALT